MSLLHALLTMLMSFQLQLVPMSDQPTTTIEPTITQGPGTPVKPPPPPPPPKQVEDTTWGDLKNRFGH